MSVTLQAASATDTGTTGDPMSAADETADETVEATEVAKGFFASIIEPMLAWLLFGVGISALPLLGGAYELWSVGKPIQLTPMLAKGELILVSVVLTGASLGELTRSRFGKGWNIFCLITAFLSTVVLMAGSFLYARVSTRTSKDYIDDIMANNLGMSEDAAAAVYASKLEDVVFISIACFVLCLLVGVATVGLKYLEDDE